MVMAVFVYIYYQSFVMVQDLSVETILEQVIWIHHICKLQFYATKEICS
jgi:hypothetical protein